MRRFIAILVTLIVMVGGEVRPAWAHPAPHSVVLLDLRSDDVGVELHLPVPELEAALGRPLSSESGALVVTDRETIRALVARDLHATSPDGVPWTLDVGAAEAATDEQGPVAVVDATLTPARNHSAQVFKLTDDVIGKEVPNHNAWISVRSDFAHGFVSGSPTVVGVTHYLRHSVQIDRGGGGSMRGFRAIFRLGMRHIAEGTDHLLFLLALLLPAPLLFVRTVNGRPRWGEAAEVHSSLINLLRIVTAFTIGHSLTLLVGALGWLRLPTAPVESLIALSILVSAVHAMRPLFPGREAWVAGGFGLVHGLAFAAALSELHLDPPRLALALLGFNLGIEAMQLVVVAATFPWLLLLARSRVYFPIRIVGASFAGLASLGWIAERALSIANPIGAWVATLAAHPYFLAGSVAGLAIATRVAASCTHQSAPSVVTKQPTPTASS